MKPTVYIETAVMSYLTAWPSRDVIRSAQQQITKRWWSDRRPEFDLFTSQFVLDEAGAGDWPNACLPIGRYHPRPDSTLHLATATTNGINYLMTCNFVA